MRSPRVAERLQRAFLLALVTPTLACGGSTVVEASGDGGKVNGDGASSQDSAMVTDTGTPIDTGTPVDTGAPIDSGSGSDSATIDSPWELDCGGGTGLPAGNVCTEYEWA